MWHEARKQERKIRGIMVNYKKRAERRRAFYERTKTDPTTFLRIQGSNYKIHIDHQNSDNINMMPWQGDRSVMIDRFDVRAHLDYIPEPSFLQTDRLITSSEEKKLNYERYRTLVMIEASGVTEEAYLRQLQQEEQNPRAVTEAVEKKEKPAPKASIGYTYEDSDLVMNEKELEPSDDDSESDLDIDVAVNVDELDEEQKDELDKLALKFGIEGGKYCWLLKADKDEAELVQKVRDEEEARSQLRGRRAKRDRRTLKDRQRGIHSNSPLSYLRRSSPSYDAYDKSRSRSRSRSSSSSGEPAKVEYITEFGSQGSKDTALPTNSDHSLRKKGSVNEESKRKHRSHKDSGKSLKRAGIDNSKKGNLSEREHSPRSHGYYKSHRSRTGSDRTKGESHSRSRSLSPAYERRSYHRSRSRSPAYERRSYNRSRSRSPSYEGRRRSRSRSRSPAYDRRYRRSRSRSRSWEDRERLEGSSYVKRTLAKDEDKRNIASPNVSRSTKTKTSLPGEKPKLTPQEKMKKRMQAALNKQLKIDKKEERKKRDEKEQERQERDDDLKEVSRRWRDKYD